MRGYYVFPSAFLKSEDGGRSWRMPQSGLAVTAARIFVDPSGSGRIYAAGFGTLHKSEDRGETWEQIGRGLGNAPVMAGSVVFGNPDRFYFVSRTELDGYLAKLDAAGNIVFTTLLGGRNEDMVTGVAFSNSGEILIVGRTRSDDLLAHAEAEKRTGGGYEDGFLARLSSDGQALLRFRYIGGSSTDNVKTMAILATGDIVVAGTSASSEFPISEGALQDGFGRTWSGFIQVYSPDLATRYSTFFGGREGSDIQLVAASGNQRLFILGGTFDSIFEGCDAPMGTCTTYLAGLNLAGIW